ncbi:SpoIIE family protein phosphatase [Streptomyces sp. NPDC055103]
MEGSNRRTQPHDLGTPDDDLDTALLGALFTSSPVGLHVLDPDLRIVRFNTAASGVHGVDPAEAVGRTWRELGFASGVVAEALRHVLVSGDPVHDLPFRTAVPVRVPSGADATSARSYALSASRLQDGGGRTLGVVVTVVDVTDRNRAQRRLDLLRRAGARIGSTLDVFRTAQELAEATVPELADAVAVDVLDRVLYGDAPAGGPLTDPVVVRRAGFRGATDGAGGAYEIGDVRVMRVATPYAQSLADLRPRLIRRLRSDDPWLTRDPGRAALIRKGGVHSLMAVPLAARGVVLGLAAFYRSGDSEPFMEADLAVASELADRTALSVDNARRFTREQTLARLTQRSLVPTRLPSHSAVQTAHSYLPAASGGTWFDVIPLSGARVALVVGEVAGYGMRAVTTMGRLRTAISALSAMDLPPDELLERLHDLTRDLADEQQEHHERYEPAIGPDGRPPTKASEGPALTAGCLYLTYDPATRHCTAARAGHPSAVLALPDGTTRVMDAAAGPALGQGIPSYEVTTTELPEGSVLALHSRGLPLDGPTADHVLGHPAAYDHVLSDMCDALVSALVPEPPADDVLLLLARTRVLGPDRLASWTLPHAPESAAEARELVRRRLEDWGLAELDFTTELIASELVTNAVRYSTGPIGLRLIRDHVLICDVTDSSSAAPHLRHAQDDDEGGRGLYLVAQFTQHWGVRPGARGKTIWAEQPLPASSTDRTPPA